MNYSDSYISEFGKQTGFINSNIEKVIRLLDVLNFLHQKFNTLVLKGGTAINLIYTNLARLSVDIDLDYVGSLNKEKTLEDKVFILKAIDDYMTKEGYIVSDKSRGSVILASRTYVYTNAFGNRDNIKVEINFIDRIHINPSVIKLVKYFDKEVMVQTCLEEELFAMKITALIDRSKPRDLFDVNKLKTHLSCLDKERLRKMTVFYMSLDGIFGLSERTFDKIKGITQDSMKKELLPVLTKGNKFDLVETKEEVLSFLKDLLVLTEDEKQYLINFGNGIFNPELLFTIPSDMERAANHPMAKWRVANVRK